MSLRTLLNVFIVISYFFLTVGWSSNAPTSWYSYESPNPVKLRVDLFLTSTCPHCLKADGFFRKLENNKPWLEVHRYLINQDKAALVTFNQYLQRQQLDDYSVPAIYFCNSRWVGFSDDGNTGRELLKGLNYCRQQIEKTGHLTPETSKILNQWANASWLESRLVYKPSTAIFIPLMAITDAINPCSIFCIIGLCAFLWLYQRKKIQLYLGLEFVVICGLIHFIQQTEFAFFYHYFHWLRIPVALIGIVLILHLLRIRCKSQAVTPHWLVVVLVACCAIGLQAYQQTCSTNFSLVFEQWLAAQQFSPGNALLIEFLYQLIYITPLLISVVVIVFLGTNKRLLNYEYRFWQLGWFILAFIGLLFIIYPTWIASNWISVLVLLLSFLSVLVMTCIPHKK